MEKDVKSRILDLEYKIEIIEEELNNSPTIGSMKNLLLKFKKEFERKLNLLKTLPVS